MCLNKIIINYNYKLLFFKVIRRSLDISVTSYAKFSPNLAERNHMDPKCANSTQNPHPNKTMILGSTWAQLGASRTQSGPGSGICDPSFKRILWLASGMCDELDSKSCVSQELKKQWDDHKTTMVMIRDILMYPL